MICFRLTPLWKIKETEQWLNDLAANGQVLRAVYGPFYSFSQSKEKKPSVHYGLDFYEKGQEHAYAPWYLKFNGLTVHTVCFYYMVYQYKLSRTRERHLEEWYPYRDRFARDALRNHLALALICLVVFPFVCYEQDLQIGFWLSIVGFFLWLVKSIYGLTVISRRLKRYRASQIQEKR